MINLFNKVLVIAAHPDDEVLGVGGTIPLLVMAKKQVDVLIFTDGSSTQYIDDTKILEDKFNEASEAMKLMGARLLPRLNFPDMRLDKVAHVDMNIALNQVLREGGYDTVFVQDCSDINRDHREIYESTMVACRTYPGQKVRFLLSYYVNSSTEWGNISNIGTFKPNVFIDIAKTIDIKLAAMEKYQTELRTYPHPRSLQAIKNSAEYFGNMIGHEFAEPFKLIFSK